MMSRPWLLVCGLLLSVDSLLSVRIRDSANSTRSTAANSSSAAGYRVSLAQAAQPPVNRVPPHLQDIHHGLVYNDADDVIHIIEPPQRFQHMKRLAMQKTEPGPWQPRPPLVTVPPLLAKKVKDAAKVDWFPWPPRAPTPPPSIKAGLKTRGGGGGGGGSGGSGGGGDLLAQTSNQQPQAMRLFGAPMAQHLPMQILASVRKTERLLQAPHRSFHLPYAKQRLKTRKVHTVLSEQRYEHDQTEHSQQMALGAEQAKQKRRVKRAAAAASSSRGDYSQQMGFKLLRNIDELLRNASAFLGDPKLREPGHSELIGEIEPNDNSLGDQDELNDLLANSLNLTEIQLAQCLHQQQQQLNATGLARIDCSQRLLALVPPSPRFGGRVASKSAPPITLQMLTYERMSGAGSGSGAAAGRAAGTAQRSSKHAEPLLLYADVMANIRNMLAAANLTELEQVMAEQGRKLGAPRAYGSAGNATQLRGYLVELQRIVADLRTAKASPKAGKIIRDTQKDTAVSDGNAVKGNRTATEDSSWFYINGEGEIFGTNSTASQLPDDGSLFHRFPDIPNAGLYISNRTVGSGSAIEILT